MWRAVIGRFNLVSLGRALTNRLSSRATEAFFNCANLSVSDVFFGWVCLLLLINFVNCARCIVFDAIQTPFLLSNSELFLRDGVVLDFVNNSSDSVLPLKMAASALAQHLPVLCLVLFVFSVRRIRLSNDIQENPGPDTQGTVISDSNPTHSQPPDTQPTNDQTGVERLEQKLDCILKAMQDQSNTLKRQEETMRQFKNDQEDLKRTVNDLHSEMCSIKSGVRRNEDSIRQLTEKQDEIAQTVESLESEVDRLESYSRRNNIKVFGIPEEGGRKDEDCAEAIRNVLETYIPSVEWPPDVIERAHRLGQHNPRNPNPRPIIAKFQRWGDAMRLMKDREAREDMANDGLRASADLTRRQSAKLKQLKDEGRSGYYHRGRLQIRREATVHDRRAAGLRRGNTENRGVLTNSDPSAPISDQQTGDTASGQSQRQGDRRPLTRAAARANTSDEGACAMTK